MTQQPGFIFIHKHCRSEIGEIDYFYRNTRDHPLQETYSYLFIECKNWKGKISSEKINHFIGLLKSKTPFFCCGIYITTSSFSQEALTAMKYARIQDGVIVISIDKKDLLELIEKGFKMFIEEKFDKMLAKA